MFSEEHKNILETKNCDNITINPNKIIENEKESYTPKINPIKLIHINQKKLNKQEKFFIEDIEVYFPYKPYERQLIYMKTIIQTLNNKYNSNDEINYNALAALESPTGTGKTLCLLCSLLAWVNAKGKVLKFSGTIIYSTRTHSQISQIISELDKTCYEPRIGILSSREYSCVNTEWKKLFGPSVLDIKCARGHKSCQFYRNIDFYAEKNFGNVDIEDIMKQGKAKKFCPFYAERTKVKMANCDLVFMPYNYIFLKEIRESLYINLKDSILVIDEAHNVISNCEDAQSLELTIKDFEEMRNDLKEVYKELGKYKGHLNPNIINIEEKVEEKDNDEEDSNNENEKNENGLIYTINIDCLAQEINLINNIINNITTTKSKFEEKKIYKNKDYIEINSDEFLSIFLSTENEIKEKQKKENNNQKTLESFFKMNNNNENKEEENKDFINISPYITEMNIIKHKYFINRIIKIIINDYSRRTKLSMLSNLLEKIISILENKSIVNSYIFCLSDEKVQTNHYVSKKVIKMNIFCFNPGIGFNEIVKFQPYSIIMTSGTLAPFDILENELKIRFDMTLENEHIIDQSQYKFVIIKGFQVYDKIIPFNFEYKNRDDLKTIASLGMTILHLCKAVKKGGILVYFTSFSYLNKCYSVWGDNNIIEQISEVKTIYFDDKKNKQLIKDFKNNKDKNSILLSVFRGTSSEGIDFKDEYARMVICVGVPYANIVEEKVQLKKQYLDEINEKSIIEGLTGRKWYLNDAISNVNQSLGRVLRHINDYGILVCIDERYEYKNIKNLFSKWIRDKSESINCINDKFFDSIEKFFDEQEKKFKNKENENIINKNANIFNLKDKDEIEKENIENSKSKNINSKIDYAFRRGKKVVTYEYEESEDQDETLNNTKIFDDKNETLKNDNEMKINGEFKEINYELELDNLTNKYSTKSNIKEKSFLNKKTNPQRNIENNEDINPNILNSNIKHDEEIMIPTNDKDKQINIKQENINIKNVVKNFANEIDNFKFNDIISSFENDKIKETQKELDENSNIKETNEDNICCVCYEIASNNPNLKFSLSKCNHILCNICWSKTLYQKLECPICRKKVRVKTLKRIIKTDTNIGENTNNKI